ncbi:MAG: ATP-binding protein [Terriglobia bacterium]
MTRRLLNNMGFYSFLGNSQAVSTLRDMLSRDAAQGSLLFAGPEGVGKKTLAFMVAKALNCERMRGDFCGQCSRCLKSEEMLLLAREDLARRREVKDASRRVEGLIYFDVQLIEPITRFVLIEQIRQLRSTAYARAFELPRRVFILDQAQAIHWQAVDLLLKVMEEPPEGATFMLVCPNPHELRPTLRSRCKRIQFRPVEDTVIRTLLQEERGIPPAQLELATRWAAGSIGAAKNLNLEEIQAKRRPWTDYLEIIAKKDWRSGGGAEWKVFFDAAKALSEKRDQLQEDLRVGYALLRDMLQMIESGDPSQITNVDLLPRLQRWAGNLGLEGLERLKRGLDDAYRLQTRNVNLQLGWETLGLNVAAGE